MLLQNVSNCPGKVLEEILLKINNTVLSCLKKLKMPGIGHEVLEKNSPIEPWKVPEEIFLKINIFCHEVPEGIFLF